MGEKEPGTERLPPPPPDANQTTRCPFCRPQVDSRTPRLHPDLSADGRLVQGDSLLFPNLFPYGSYSAVSLFDNNHFVEIGRASAESYANSFLNCSRYLAKIHTHDPRVAYTAITQNHLPSAGGSFFARQKSRLALRQFAAAATSIRAALAAGQLPTDPAAASQ